MNCIFLKPATLILPLVPRACIFVTEEWNLVNGHGERKTDRRNFGLPGQVM